MERGDPKWLVALACLGLAVTLPWWTAPFGFFELNAGFYFGPFAQAFDRFGFIATRGIPIGATEFIPMVPASGYPYLNHPPGAAWLMALFGPSEWQMRCVPSLALAACGPLLFALLRGWPVPCRLSAAALFTLIPAVAPLSLVSYEVMVMATGLALWVGFSRRGSRAGRVAMTAAAVAGAWLDWSFGFFVLALAFVEPLRSGGLSRWKPIVVAWSRAAVSCAAVVAWIIAARSADLSTATVAQAAEPTSAMMDRALFRWPLPGQFFGGIGRLAWDCFTPPVLIAGLAGQWWVARRGSVMLLALWLPGLLNVLAFPAHACANVMFLSFFALPLCVGAGAVVAVAGRFGSVIAVSAFAAIALWPVLDGWRFKQSASDALFAEVGEALSNAVARDAAEGAHVFAATNAPQFYPYYAANAAVYLFPVVSPEPIRAACARGATVRFLHLDFRVDSHGGVLSMPTDHGLPHYLSQFTDRIRVRHLLGEHAVGPHSKVVIRDAWLYVCRETR